MTDFEAQCLEALFLGYGPEALVSYVQWFCETYDYPHDAEVLKDALAAMKRNDEEGRTN